MPKTPYELMIERMGKIGYVIKRVLVYNSSFRTYQQTGATETKTSFKYLDALDRRVLKYLPEGWSDKVDTTIFVSKNTDIGMSGTENPDHVELANGRRYRVESVYAPTLQGVGGTQLGYMKVVGLKEIDKITS